MFCAYWDVIGLKYFDSFGAGTVFIRQNLTSTDSDSDVQRVIDDIFFVPHFRNYTKYFSESHNRNINIMTHGTNICLFVTTLLLSTNIHYK